MEALPRPRLASLLHNEGKFSSAWSRTIWPCIVDNTDTSFSLFEQTFGSPTQNGWRIVCARNKARVDVKTP